MTTGMTTLWRVAPRKRYPTTETVWHAARSPLCSPCAISVTPKSCHLQAPLASPSMILDLPPRRLAQVRQSERGELLKLTDLMFCLTRSTFVVRMNCSFVVLWRPEALDCRVLIPPEAWNGLTPNTPRLGIEPRTSCI